MSPKDAPLAASRLRSAGIAALLWWVMALIAPAPALGQAGTPAIAIGEGHVLVLAGDRSVWAWGRNDQGQLGDGSLLERATPVRVPGLANVVAIATRVHSSFAVTADGSVWAWGRNGEGQLGDGTTTSRSTPTRLAGIDRVIAISAGGLHALALRADGTVWSWGGNILGQVGDGTTIDRKTPVPVSGLTGVRTVRAGAFASLAVTTDGTAWGWGTNLAGAIGTGEDPAASLVPIRIPALPQSASGPAAMGDYHGLVLQSDGTLRGFGRNVERQLATLEDEILVTPIAIPGVSSIRDVASKNDFVLALRGDGALLAWGAGGVGQLGAGANPARDATPRSVPGLPAVVAFDAGFYTAGAIAQGGAVWIWGDNSYRQAGDKSVGPTFAPRRVAGPGGIGFFDAVAGGAASNRLPEASFTASPNEGVAPMNVTVDAGSSRDTDGSIASHEWTTSTGLAATGPRATFAFPQSGRHLVRLRVTDDRGAVAFAERTIVVESAANLAVAGVAPTISGNASAVSIASGSDGRAYTWSYSRTQLGNGPPPSQVLTAPEEVAGLRGVIAVATAGTATYALKADGSVWAWGYNQFGQLGDGSTLRRDRPVQVQRVSGAIAIATYSRSAAALLRDGTVWTWGYGEDGQLGTGGFPTLQAPTPVPGLSGVTAIAAGAHFMLALRSDGTVWGWGQGIPVAGTSGLRPLPVPVPGLSGVRAISAGQGHSLAALADGSVRFWGRAVLDLIPQALSPVPVPGLEGIVAVSTRGFSFAALGSDGTLWTWGLNDVGQLGDGTFVDRTTPAPVLRNIATMDAGIRLLAIDRDGFGYGTGYNVLGYLGDGTLANRSRPVLVVGRGGSGFLRLRADGASVPADKVPPFPVLVAGQVADGSVGGIVSAQVNFRPQDVGGSAGLFVFALAPQALVHAAPGGGEPLVAGFASARDGAKADAVPCVLAQLNASGQLVGVSASALQAAVSGVLSAQGQSLTVLNNVNPASIAGTTFFVGYGANGQGMLDGGTNRSVLSVPGGTECKPQPPQTGWWWNPAEGGRGFSIETSGNRLFMAAYLYDVSGRASWLVSGGPTSLDGSLFTGRLLSVANGQTLAGAYRKPAPITDVGAVTMAFTDASHGTLVWPGGSIPIERFNIVPGGLAAAPQANQPESGWWWNAAEDGRGFFIEWQNGSVDLAGYMYDDAGNPIWYITVQPTPNPRAIGGNWWQYGGGQTLTGAYRPATRINDNVAPVTVQFSGPENAIMTLPGGRQLPLTRYRF